MGMFDTVHFNCPDCSEPIELQTKAGDCTLSHYRLDGIPEVIAESLRETIQYMGCEKCGSHISFEPRIKVGVIAK